MTEYTYLRQVEKRLIARLETLGYPIGITTGLLAKIQQLRAKEARKITDRRDLTVWQESEP